MSFIGVGLVKATANQGLCRQIWATSPQLFRDLENICHVKMNKILHNFTTHPPHLPSHWPHANTNYFWMPLISSESWRLWPCKTFNTTYLTKGSANLETVKAHFTYLWAMLDHYLNANNTQVWIYFLRQILLLLLWSSLFLHPYYKHKF